MVPSCRSELQLAHVSRKISNHASACQMGYLISDSGKPGAAAPDSAATTRPAVGWRIEYIIDSSINSGEASLLTCLAELLPESDCTSGHPGSLPPPYPHRRKQGRLCSPVGKLTLESSFPRELEQQNSHGSAFPLLFWAESRSFEQLNPRGILARSWMENLGRT